LSAKELLTSLKDIITKISTPIQLIAFIVGIIVFQLASLSSLSFSPLAIISVVLLVSLAAFVYYISRQKSLIDNQIIAHEAIIDWIEAFKEDKKHDPTLVRELDVRQKEQQNSLDFANKQKQKF
jgi:hypothetical protein